VAATRTGDGSGAPTPATGAGPHAHPDLDLPDGGLLGAIVRLNLAVTRVLEDHAGRCGLTFADYLVLGVVRRSPDQRSAPTAIAATLDRTTGGMTLTLDRLERAGLVRRTRHARDGRRVVIELTAPGRRVATAVNEALHRWEDELELAVPTAAAVALLDDLTATIGARTT
jgi:DNA-binding MarR family transcriptional regulator